MSVFFKKRKYITREQYNKIKSSKEGTLCSYCKKNYKGEVVYYIIGNAFEMGEALALIDNIENE